jgi:hypothetical protein
MDKFATELLKLFEENFGITVTTILLVFLGLLYYIHKMYQRFLSAKDAEIRRLYEDNRRLQEAIMSNLKRRRR